MATPSWIPVRSVGSCAIMIWVSMMDLDSPETVAARFSRSATAASSASVAAASSSSGADGVSQCSGRTGGGVSRTTGPAAAPGLAGLPRSSSTTVGRLLGIRARTAHAGTAAPGSIVTLIASPLLTMSIAFSTSESGRWWVIRSSTGTLPDEISSSAWRLCSGLDPLAP